VHVVAAPDKFKGTATAAQVAGAVAQAVVEAGGTCDEQPLADGGEGTLEALGGANRTTVVTGPLGDEVAAPWRLSKGTAVVEMALASGITLVGGAEANDALAASTYGTGELIAAAVDAGAHRVIVGVGGSATTDGGLGALRALYPLQRFRGTEVIVACDVRTPFVHAAETFSAQKGASPAQVRFLTRRLESLAATYREEHGVDVASLVGGGAAGGLAGGLAAGLGADLVSGFDLVADELDLDEHLEGADLVITGEGYLDAESIDGKVVGGVRALATQHGVPTLAVVGDADLAWVDANRDLIGSVERLVTRCGEDRALRDTLACIHDTVLAALTS
jgi:glycerate kinase